MDFFRGVTGDDDEGRPNRGAEPYRQTLTGQSGETTQNVQGVDTV